MKKTILASFTFLILFSFDAFCQESTCYYHFNTGNDHTDTECMEKWEWDSGSSEFHRWQIPYRVINAIEDIGLKIDGSDNSTIFKAYIDGLQLKINQRHVIYFPAGNYYFTTKINLSDKHDLVLKGESAAASQLVAYLRGQVSL